MTAEAQAKAVVMFAASARRDVDSGDWTRALRLLRLADVASKQLQQTVVDAMRAEGASWQAIADAMGVSKQSANARFSHDNNARQRKTA